MIKDEQATWLKFVSFALDISISCIGVNSWSLPLVCYQALLYCTSCPLGVSVADIFYKQKAWSSILPEFRCSSVKSTWYSKSRYVAANTGGIISDFSLSSMRSIIIVASGVEICSYDSMVSCQWPNVLPGVSTLSWSFVVSVRTGIKDSTVVSLMLALEGC